jgi:hypothetical protein
MPRFLMHNTEKEPFRMRFLTYNVQNVVLGGF